MIDSPPQALGMPAHTTGHRRAQSRRPPAQGATVLPPGHLVGGRYRIVSLLGTGGMGAVYRAEHLAMRRNVAIKVLRPEHARDATMAQRFEREAQATSRIHSPLVISVYDFGRSDDGLLYLTMEMLEGESLASRLDRVGQLGWPAALQIVGAVARALETVHAAGVVHRDIKPDNVFLCRDGTVKLLDFGIARFVDTDPEIAPSAKLTQAGSVIGTALYVSPEACAQKPIGPAADLYALGATLFEMVTGRWVFEEEQPVVLMSAHLRTIPDRIRDVRPDLDLPPALDALVARLLAKRPEQRPASASKLAEDVQEILASHPHPAPLGDASFRDEATFVDTKPRGAREAVTTHVSDKTQADARPGRALVLAAVVVVILALIAAIAGWALSSGDDGPREVIDTSPLPSTTDVVPATTPPATATPPATITMDAVGVAPPDVDTTTEAVDPIDLAPTSRDDTTPRMRRPNGAHTAVPSTSETSMGPSSSGLIDMF